MRNVNFNKLGDRLLITIEGYRRRRSVAYILEERKTHFPIMVPVYEELFEQVARSLWGLCFPDEEREEWDVEGEAAELLNLIRSWEANVAGLTRSKSVPAEEL